MTEKSTRKAYGGVFIGFAPEFDVENTDLEYKKPKDEIWSAFENAVGENVAEELANSDHYIEVDVDEVVEQ